MARESEFWAWFKGQHKKHPQQASIHASRVENLVEKAYPDIEGVAFSAWFSMETKVLKKVRKDASGGTLTFETGQREWAARRWRAGGAAYVLVEGHGQGLYLIPGLLAPALPLDGVVETRDLEDMNAFTLPVSGLPTPIFRGAPGAFEALLDVLSAPGTIREFVERMFPRLRPDLYDRAIENRASPVQALLG